MPRQPDGRCRNRKRREKHDGGMTERKPETDAYPTPALLEEFPRNVVDGGDVISVDRVTHTKTVGEECRAEHRRMAAKAVERPRPDEEICGDQKRIEYGEPAAHIGMRKVKHLHQQI